MGLVQKEGRGVGKEEMDKSVDLWERTAADGSKELWKVCEPMKDQLVTMLIKGTLSRMVWVCGQRPVEAEVGWSFSFLAQVLPRRERGLQTQLELIFLKGHLGGP